MAKPIKPLVLLVLCAAAQGIAQQVNDPEFSARVEQPAFTKKHPRIGIDEAHRNFHTREGRYKPFASLMESDGYVVSAAPRFESGLLKGVDILVIANALGEARDGGMGPAFTPLECDAVRDWVRDGGSLLLIADHAPFGDAAAIMAERFGVEVGRGYVVDLKNSEGNPTNLVFSVENGLLGDHAIVRGRNQAEQVRRIVSFTGQSLGVPAEATALMKLSTLATETSDLQELKKIVGGLSAGKKVEGRAQGIVMPFGKGRVAVFGEAAMFSAQVATINGRSIKAGMNVPGNDDRQFALNLMHWLARLIN